MSAPNSGKAIVTIETRKNLGDVLHAAQASIGAVLPKHMNIERLFKLALLASIKTPKLLQCTKESVLESLMTAAQLGLEPNGMLGSGYLVPFDNRRKGVTECQFIPGYRGLVDLAKRSGEIDGVEARVVYQSDVFKPYYGTSPRIEHEPAFEGDLSDATIRAFYVVATFAGGHKQFEIMPKKKVDAIRERSRSKDSGPWVTDYAEMGKKTVTKRAAKYWPLSPEKAGALAAAIEHDNRVETGEISGMNVDIDTEASLSADVADKTRGRLASLSQRINGDDDVEMEQELARQDAMDGEG